MKLETRKKETIRNSLPAQALGTDDGQVSCRGPFERAVFQEAKGEAEASRDRGAGPIRGPDWDPESPDWGVVEGGLETSRRL